MKVGLNLVNLQTKKVDARNMDKGSIAASKPVAFTGSNTNQIAHFVPEMAPGLFKGGGVGDVIYDFAKVFPELDPSKEHFFFMPFYNADYYSENGKTIAKPVNYANQTYMVNDTRDITKYNGEVNKWKVSEIASDTMETIDSTGKSKMTDIGLYQVDSTELAERLGISKDKVKVFATLTPGTGSMDKQYGFSYKDGSVFKHYSENSRASVQLMNKLSEATNGQFDPAYFTFHDYHGTAGMAHIQHAAQKNNPLFEKAAVSQIIHNGGRGYQGLGASPLEFFMSYATPSQAKQLVNSQEYMSAVKMMPQDGGAALEELIKGVMPHMVDETGTLNPSMGVAALGRPLDGAVPVAKGVPVSGPYADELGKFPEMSEGTTGGYKGMQESGRFKGIINGSVYPTEKTLIEEPLFNPHQANKIEMVFKDGKPVEYFQTYDPASIKTIEDVHNVVLPAKQNNKLKFFERFVKRDEVVAPEQVKNWDPSFVITSATSKPPAKFYTNIDTDTLEKLIKNPDTVFFDSWGRGDFQKGLDELLLGFKKYVLDPKNAKDTSSILTVSAGLGKDAESMKIKGLLDEMLGHEKFKGRILFIDGWCAPKAMTTGADYSLFTSRYEPCGLTIPISRSTGAVVGASKTGGQQAMVKTGEDASGFLTEHSYFSIGRKEIEESSYGAEFKKTLDGLIQAKKDKTADVNLRLQRVGKAAKPLTDEEVLKSVMKSEGYQNLIRQYRDEIMSDEFKGIYESMVKQTKDEKAKMILSGLKNELGWDASYKQYNEFLWSEAVSNPAQAAKIIVQEKLDALTRFAQNAGGTGGTLDISTKDIENAINSGSNGIKEAIKEGFAGLNGQGSEKNFRNFLENIPFKGKVAAAAGAAALLATTLWAVASRSDAKKEEQKEKAASAAVYVPSVPVNNFIKTV